MKIPWMAKEEIALKASDLLKDFERNAEYAVKPPIPVEDIIERTLGVELRYVDLQKILGKDDVLGATYVASRVICVNERLFENGSEGRVAFTCAHEAGHWVLHRPFLENGGKVQPGKESILCRISDAGKPIEWQADYFASCLLMPEGEIREAFARICALEPLVVKRRRGETCKASKSEEPYLEQWPYIAAAMCELGGFSNVSWQAMIIRLQDLGLLLNMTDTKMDWQALW